MEQLALFGLSGMAVGNEPSSTILLAEAVCVDWFTEREGLVCDQLSCVATGASAKTVR